MTNASCSTGTNISIRNKRTSNFNMKQIMTSITRLDKCLFAETQNMHVAPKGLRNKEYKGTNFVSFLQHR